MDKRHDFCPLWPAGCIDRPPSASDALSALALPNAAHPPSQSPSPLRRCEAWRAPPRGSNPLATPQSFPPMRPRHSFFSNCRENILSFHRLELAFGEGRPGAPEEGRGNQPQAAASKILVVLPRASSSRRSPSGGDIGRVSRRDSAGRGLVRSVDVPLFHLSLRWELRRSDQSNLLAAFPASSPPRLSPAAPASAAAARSDRPLLR